MKPHQQREAAMGAGSCTPKKMVRIAPMDEPSIIMGITGQMFFVMKGIAVSVNISVPVTYAALFTGPPMSKAHMQPIARPNTTGPAAERLCRKSIIAVLMVAMGPEIVSITRPTTTDEHTGYSIMAMQMPPIILSSAAKLL